MKVLLISVGTEVYFIRNTNLISVGTTNLALGKHATQSSTYRYSDPVAGYAVDGNTDGKFLWFQFFY
jgi:hypothetical protein